MESKTDIVHHVAINNYFNQWYTAINDAYSLSSGNIGTIVAEIDPPDSGFPLSSILTILSAGLALIPGPLGIASSVLSKTAQATINVLAVGIAQVPALTNILFPTGSIDSEVVQAAQLSGQLSTLASGIADRLDAALKLSVTDFPTFLALAETNVFYAPVWDDDQLTKNMAHALNAYVISSCLEGNNIHGVVGVATNPQALSTTTLTDYQSSPSQP